MDTQTELKWIHKELDKVKDPDVLEIIKELILNGKNNTSDERISVERYNQEIEVALSEIDAGKVIGQKEMEDRIAQWKEK